MFLRCWCFVFYNFNNKLVLNIIEKELYLDRYGLKRILFRILWWLSFCLYYGYSVYVGNWFNRYYIIVLDRPYWILGGSFLMDVLRGTVLLFFKFLNSFLLLWTRDVIHLSYLRWSMRSFLNLIISARHKQLTLRDFW